MPRREYGGLRQMGDRKHPLYEPVVERRSHDREGGENQHWAHEQDAEIVAELARETAWPAHMPDVIQRGLDALDHRQRGIEQRHEPDGPQYAELEVVAA